MKLSENKNINIRGNINFIYALFATAKGANTAESFQTDTVIVYLFCVCLFSGVA